MSPWPCVHQLVASLPPLPDNDGDLFVNDDGEGGFEEVAGLKILEDVEV